jgi:polygalacturonase
MRLHQAFLYTVLLLLPLAALLAADKPLGAWQPLVRTESWNEQWPDASGKAETRKVTAEVWTQAMQASLDAQGTLHIPARAQPYYLDGPLVLKSGHKLSADPTAEIRLKPNSNTCMVRNEHVVTLNTKPVPGDQPCDADISIEGGVWSTLANNASFNGNQLGLSAKTDPAFGTHGVILLQNVRRVSVKNLTIRQSRPFGVHLANAREFRIENITLEETRRDGVHVNGPASDGLIRGVRGDPHDDNVALNAWEWKNYAPSYGPIERIVIEDITGAPEGVSSTRAIRLLPGVKRFSDGSTLDCPISDVTLRRITDIREFKLYDQPNLELGRANDFSAGVGTLKNITFEKLTLRQPGVIQVHAHTDGLTVRDVRLLFPATAGYHLIELGPLSQTYKPGRSEDPAKWVEIFSPDLDCTVRNVNVSGVRLQDSPTDLPFEEVVKVIELKPNPDYPKTTPKGGTGKGILVR